MKIYSIHDQAAEFFLPPFLAQTSGQAQRMFIGSLGDSFPHRKDFTLYEIGEFDDADGVIMALPEPLKILSGLSIPADLDPRVPNPTQLETTPEKTQ